MTELNSKIKKNSRILKIFMFSICASFACAISSHTQGLAKGTAADGTGGPLPGVSAAVKGTTNGTTTDVNGKYSIQVTAKDILSFSYVGMSDQGVKVAGQTTVNVVMKDDVAALDEVIVVGYGTTKKQSLTGTVSAVKGDELLKTPATSASNFLGGRLPGISSVQVSSEPGDDQVTLRVRGSIYDAAYIVDGMPRSINDIDPNDTESVPALEGGASTTVYGLKGAGGATIITTKKGQRGKSKITYNGSIEASMDVNFLQFMSGPRFAYCYNIASMMDKMANESISNISQYNPAFTKASVEAMLNDDPIDGRDSANYIDKVFGADINQKHNIVIQGGSDRMRYFASVGYLDQKGNIDSFSHERYNLRASPETQLTKNFQLSSSIIGNVGKHETPGYASGGTNSNSESGEQGWLSVAHQTIMMHPYLSETYDGFYSAITQNNTSPPNSPSAAIYEPGYKHTDSSNLQTNVFLQYSVPWTEDLSVKAAGAYGYTTSYNKNLNTPYSTYIHKMPISTADRTWSKADDSRGTVSGIDLDEGQYSSHQMVGQGSTNYVNSFGKHSIEGMVLVEIRGYKENSSSGYSKDMSFPELSESSFEQPADPPTSGYNDASRNIGYVFRLKYDYDNKHSVKSTGRYDDSYKFVGSVSGKRWVFFPSALVTWRIPKEGFMPGLTFLDDMKTRASVGLLGNGAMSPYTFLSTYNLMGGNKNVYRTILSGRVMQALCASVITNSTLTWENTLTYNAGFNFTMWNGLLRMESDALYNYTCDILTIMGGDYSPSMRGYYYTYTNYNKVDSEGVEVTVSRRDELNLAGKPFSYGISFNLTFARNRYLHHPDSPNTVEWGKHAGRSVDASITWAADGLFRSEEEIGNSTWYDVRLNAGGIKYRDLNGDGKIDKGDRTRIGRDNRPELTYGLNLDCTWSGFDLSTRPTGGVLLGVSLAGTYYNGYDGSIVWTQTFKEGANSPLYLVQDAYTVESPSGTFLRLTLGNQGHGGDNGLASTFWLRNGRYFRLKSAQLGYAFPKRWMSPVGIQNLRIYVEDSNLFTISGLSDEIDPESPGVDNGYYPRQRTIMGGITLTL